jgi:hypothetical protein
MISTENYFLSILFYNKINNKIINVVFVEINETYQNDDGVSRQLYWMSFEKFIKKYESFCCDH